jgi:hypothetical protein
MSGSVLLHRQLSPEDLNNSSIGTRFVTLFWTKLLRHDIKRVLELASVCEHPNAVWLTKLFGGHDVASREEARQVFLGCENDPRALCFAGRLVNDFDEIRRAADLGDAFAQASMSWHTRDEERFRWEEKSSAQGERDGFYHLGDCYRNGFGCEKDKKRAKENNLEAAELGEVSAMVCLGKEKLLWPLHEK